MLTAKLGISELDIKLRIKELGIEKPTKKQLETVKLSIQSIARAWACAYLQDMDRAELDSILEDIE